MNCIFGAVLGPLVVLGTVSFPLRAVDNGCNEIRIFSNGGRVWDFAPGMAKLTCIDAGTGRRWQAQRERSDPMLTGNARCPFPQFNRAAGIPRRARPCPSPRNVGSAAAAQATSTAYSRGGPAAALRSGSSILRPQA
jgi:hypothetical protein